MPIEHSIEVALSCGFIHSLPLEGRVFQISSIFLENKFVSVIALLGK